jgi:hypothetical protein
MMHWQVITQAPSHRGDRSLDLPSQRPERPESTEASESGPTPGQRAIYLLCWRGLGLESFYPSPCAASGPEPQCSVLPHDVLPLVRRLSRCGPLKRNPKHDFFDRVPSRIDMSVTQGSGLPPGRSARRLMPPLCTPHLSKDLARGPKLP